jgi:hypothetical protein
MSCISQTSTPALSLSRRRWKRPAFIAALILVVEAFQEALEMRRAAQKRSTLLDNE